MMSTRILGLFMLGVVLTFGPFSQTEAAQILGIGKKSLNTELIPQNAFAAAVMFPKQIAEDPKFELLPREIITAWGLKEFGFDPMLIKQITFVAKRMDALNGPPEWGAVLHFEEMQGLTGKMVDQLERKQVGNRALFSGAAQGLPSFLVYDESTMLVGDESFFVDMIAANNKGRVVSLLKRRSVSGEVVAVVDIESVRPMLQQASMMIPGMMPPAITKLRNIPDLVQAIEIGIAANKRIETSIVIHTADDDSAEQAAKIMTEALAFGTDMGIGAVAAQMDFNDPVQEALVEYVQRVSEDYNAKLSPSVSGNRMSLKLDQELTVVPVMIGMLLPAVQQVRTAARRTSSMNNSRQHALAMLNYQSAYGKFPAQANYDKNGKPLLSWRVHVLPFMEQQALYDQFHLDEPWDSPHNRKLIGKMPMIYASPGVILRPGEGKTVFLGVAGEGRMFGKEGKDFSDITDGSSNTVLAVEVNAEQAVVWSRPVDYEPDSRNPLAGLGGVYPGGFNASKADGSVQFISNGIDPETWLKLLTIAGGEVSSGN
jgi:hypothetical protein